MQNVEFAAGYSDRYLTGPSPMEAPGSLAFQADRWSSLFGHALLEHMKTGDTKDFDTSTLDSYADWYGANTGAILAAPLSQEPGSHPLHFHGLNSIMINMWRPVTGEQWSEARRQYFLKDAQDVIATRGLELYIQKLRIVQVLERQNQNYFDPTHEPLRRRVEGTINEYDAAVVLLGIAGRLQNANVVPGPAQLETGIGSTKNGADYVFMHEDQAVGVQVKSSILSGHAATYDPSRVVLVDGRLDMGNEKMVRTDNKSSKLSHVSWAGLISASHVIGMNLRGHDNVYLTLGNGPRRTILQYKMHAREALRGVKPHNLRAQQIIGTRIVDALYED